MATTAREYRDELRKNWVENPSVAPSRTILYTRDNDDFPVTLESFVGGGHFNEEEKKTLEDYQVFSALSLEQEPVPDDKVTYDGITFRVTRVSKLGELWTVYGKKSRHRGR